MKRLDLIELPGHVGLVALGQPWMTDEHMADLLVACQIGCDLADPADDIHAMATEGKALLLANSTNYDTMRQIIGHVVQWVAKQPNRRIHDAVTRHLKKMHATSPITSTV